VTASESSLRRAIKRDLVVIGASAGGVETLKRVVERLPPDLPAAVCIVLHIAPDTPSLLAQILSRSGALPCHAARGAERLRRGAILVASPDRHLVVEDEHVYLSVGPRENGHRPAVDVLFRSAAAAQGARVIGVILSGRRGDGAVGLAAVKAAGGATIVQDPRDALYPGMPSIALAHVAPDAVVPSERVADTIVAMINGDDPPPGAKTSPPDASGGVHGEGETTICPECGGVLTERHEAGTMLWQCRVGHRYSPESLLDVQAMDVEAAMWAGVRALEDRSRLLKRMAEQFEPQGRSRSARSFRDKAHDAAEQARAVREVLMRAGTVSLTRDEPGDLEPEEIEIRRASSGGAP